MKMIQKENDKEAFRLEALDRYHILDTSAEQSFDDLTRLAAYVCRTPTALISLVDSTRQWFKSRHGFELKETSREVSFCAHAIVKEDVLIVSDATTDERFQNNPLVKGPPNIRFYAGAPLVTDDGNALGTICVLDSVPRQMSREQQEALQILSRQVIAQLELRRSLAELKTGRGANLRAEIGTALARGTSTLQETLQFCAQTIVHHLDAAFCRIWSLNQETNILELQASAGMYTHLDGSHSHIPVGKFKIGLIAEEKKPHLTNDVLNDPRVSDKEWAKREGMIAFAGYPLLVEDRLVGVLALFSRKPLLYDIIHSLASISDVMAQAIKRKKVEDALRQSEAFVRCVLDSLKDTIAVLDRKGFVIAVNESWKRFVLGNGLSLPGIGSNYLESCIKAQGHSPQAEQQVLHGIHSVLSGIQAAFSLDHPFHCRAETDTKWFLLHATGLQIPQGGAVVSHVDVTDLVLAQEAFSKQEEELRQSRKMEAIGNLAGGIAHDFNNLLMAIGGHSELVLSRTGDTDPLRVDLEEIVKSVEIGGALTRQLLAFSRKQVLKPVVLDLNLVLQNLEQILRRLIRQNILLHIIAAKDLPPILADASQIDQVILNLVVNARDAMPDGGQLRIETASVLLEEQSGRKKGKYALLSVIDTGIGMDEATKQRIFEPFFTTKPKEQGTGLGLSTVYGIVRQSHAHLKVESEPGIGTTFRIYFPATERDVEKDVSEALKTDLPVGSETLLLVDDNHSVRTAIASLLEMRGYRVLEADNGKEALQVVSDHQGLLHMLITDLMMPFMQGNELAQELLKDYPSLKILFLSGYSEDNLLDSERNSAFLQKPVRMPILFHKIREMLDSG